MEKTLVKAEIVYKGRKTKTTHLLIDKSVADFINEEYKPNPGDADFDDNEFTEFVKKRDEIIIKLANKEFNLRLNWWGNILVEYYVPNNGFAVKAIIEGL